MDALDTLPQLLPSGIQPILIVIGSLLCPLVPVLCPLWPAVQVAYGRQNSRR